MATTFEAIRDAQCALIEALTPRKHAGVRFRRHREGDFMQWVAGAPQACLRRFQIARNFDDEQLPTADGSLEGCRHTMELRVAYPVGGGLYGSENERDMDDLLDSDRRQLDTAIGLYAYATSVDAVSRLANMTLIEGEATRVLSMTYSLEYDRSV